MATAISDRSDLAGNSRSEPFIFFWEPVPLTLATGWRRFFLWLEESLPEPAAPSEQMLR